MTTDPDLPLDQDELAVQAVVDGDATADQRRRVARDAELVARVRAAEAVHDAVRAPIDGPAPDVFAALRSRAIAALDDEGTAPDPITPVTEPEPAVVPDADRADRSWPTDDLAERRARRLRRLPPLPAVAAVVLILLLGGIALLVTDREGDADQVADTATAEAADAEAGGDGGSADDDAASATEAESGGDTASADSADGPSTAAQEALVARATSSYADEDDLFDALRRVDPDTLDLGSPVVATSPGEDPATTTTVAEGGGAPASTTEPSPPTGGASGGDGSVLADDPDVQRCDSVLRSAEPGIGRATAAAFVTVDGVAVVILSNPVEAGADGPATTRLTVLNALDCSPRGAVQR